MFEIAKVPFETAPAEIMAVAKLGTKMTAAESDAHMMALIAQFGTAVLNTIYKRPVV